jgi:hypothetical protein
MSFEELCFVFLDLTDHAEKVKLLLQMRDFLRANPSMM